MGKYRKAYLTLKPQYLSVNISSVKSDENLAKGQNFKRRKFLTDENFNRRKILTDEILAGLSSSFN